MSGHLIDDGHIHVWAGDMYAGNATGEIAHCIACGCTYQQATQVNPVLYPSPFKDAMDRLIDNIELSAVPTLTEVCAHDWDWRTNTCTKCGVNLSDDKSWVGETSMLTEGEIKFGGFKFTSPNTHIHLSGRPPQADNSGDVVFNFTRLVPFTRFQVWMIKWCFGWHVEQDPR